jgi:hypothetical protein
LLGDVHVVQVDDIWDADLVPDELGCDVVVITDPSFRLDEVRTAAKKVASDRGNGEAECFFFEDDPEVCLLNVRHRDRGRPIEDLIQDYIKLYDIDHGTKPFDVRHPDPDDSLKNHDG